MVRLLFLVGLVTMFPFLVQAEGPWAYLDIPFEQEGSSLAKLEVRGIEAIGWSNAVVEISVFEGLETVPLSRLGSRLTPADPRWDPWLKGLEHRFRPSPGIARLCVEADQKQRALRTLGFVGASTPGEAVSSPSPSLVTGWLLVFFAVLYGVLWLVSGLMTGGPWWKDARRWAGMVLAIVLLFGGSYLVAGPGHQLDRNDESGPLWLQHRWFQENWPWGARWSDWAPGKTWTYRSYEHQNGALVEVQVSRTPSDLTWALGAWKTLDPRHAARPFGFPNP